MRPQSGGPFSDATATLLKTEALDTLYARANDGSGYSSTKSVLHASNFTLKGAYYLPSPSGAASPGRCMTGRVRDGVFYMISGDGMFAEWIPPTPTTSAFPTPTISIQHGAMGFTPYNQSLKAPPAAFFLLFQIYWDETDARMHFICTDYYQQSVGSDVNIGYATQGAAQGSAWTLAGMWRTSGTVPEVGANGRGSRFGSGMTALPSDFADDVCSGKRLGFTGGPGISILSDYQSFGPTLFAMNPLTTGDAHQSVMSSPFQPILYYPYHDVAYNVPRIARRPPTAATLNREAIPGDPDDSWMPNAGVEYWCQADNCWAAAWLDFPALNLHGYLVIPTITEGNASSTVVADLGASGITRDVQVQNATGFVVGMGCHVPSVDVPTYGGYYGLVAAVTGNVLTFHHESYAPFSYVATTGEMVSAGIWYGGAGPKCPLFRTWGMVYDPVTLATLAEDSDGPWSESEPDSSWEMPFDYRRTYPLPGNQGAFPHAIVRNPLNNDVHVLVGNADRGPDNNASIPMVYVYEVVA